IVSGRDILRRFFSSRNQRSLLAFATRTWGTNHEPYPVSQLGYHCERRAAVVAVYRLRQIAASSPVGLGNGEASTNSVQNRSYEVTRNAVRYHGATAIC